MAHIASEKEAINAEDAKGFAENAEENVFAVSPVRTLRALRLESFSKESLSGIKEQWNKQER